MAEKLILIVYLYICLSFIYGLYFVQVQIILSRLSQTNLLFQIRSNSEIHSIGEFESKKEQNQIKNLHESHFEISKRNIYTSLKTAKKIEEIISQVRTWNLEQKNNFEFD